jgi:hypothetical protein
MTRGWRSKLFVPISFVPVSFVSLSFVLISLAPILFSLTGVLRLDVFERAVARLGGLVFERRREEGIKGRRWKRRRSIGDKIFRLLWGAGYLDRRYLSVLKLMGRGFKVSYLASEPVTEVGVLSRE